MTLIERLEVAEAGSRHFDNAIQLLVNGGRAFGVDPHYTTSLDAAMTLLPENWCIALLEWWPMTGIKAGITLREVKTFDGDFASTGYDEACGAARARAETPALALCIASLRARSAS